MTEKRRPHSRFKRMIRERMAADGTNYTTARTRILQEKGTCGKCGQPRVPGGCRGVHEEDEV